MFLAQKEKLNKKTTPCRKPIRTQKPNRLLGAYILLGAHILSYKKISGQNNVRKVHYNFSRPADCIGRAQTAFIIGLISSFFSYERGIYFAFYKFAVQPRAAESVAVRLFVSVFSQRIQV